MIDREHHPLKREPQELWEETRHRIVERQRLLDVVKGVCTCARSVDGPSYMGIAWCRRCALKIT